MWHHLVSQWIRSQATEHAREAVFRAAQGAPGAGTAPHAEAGDEPPAGPPPPCDVGLVFALGIEAGGTLDLLEGVVKIRGHEFVAYEGAIAGRRVVLIEAGPGREKAARATEALIDGHQPAWVISAGFAGGLVDGLARNDLFVPNSVAWQDSSADPPRDERLAIDVKMPPAPHLHIGRLLTVDAVVRTADDKRGLASAHEAQAVDMETFAIAAACQARKTRFFSVRVISDEVGDELPPEIEHLLHQETLSGRLGAAAGSIFRRPSSIKDLWKLKETALVASDRLGKFLAELVGQLAPREPRE